MEAMAASGTHSTQILALERNARSGSVEAIHLDLTLRPGDDTSSERRILAALIEVLEEDSERDLLARLHSLERELEEQDASRKM
jgi:hypothetical protein